MYHMNIESITQLGQEIIYIDESTAQKLSGVVGRIEYLDSKTAFVYVVSPYNDENNKVEPDGFRYRDIIVFDDQPETVEGWHKNDTLARSKNWINRSR